MERLIALRFRLGFRIFGFRVLSSGGLENLGSCSSLGLYAETPLVFLHDSFEGV